MVVVEKSSSPLCLEKQFASLIKSEIDMTPEMAIIHNNVLTQVLTGEKSLFEASTECPGLTEIISDPTKPLYRLDIPPEVDEYIFSDPQVTKCLERNKVSRTAENAELARIAMYRAACRWFLQENGVEISNEEIIEPKTA